MASGITTGTGALPVIDGSKFLIALRFGGGSVDIEQKMPSGSFIKLETGITSDVSLVFDGPCPTALRLNVTDHSSPIEWAIDAR